jgi:hypothetical protein
MTIVFATHFAAKIAAVTHRGRWWGAASAHEHHVSMDVAFAFSQFLHATHDWEWGRKRAWDVLAEIAAWIASRGVETERGFEIREVNGIAERKEKVDNNAFVNMAAAVALREAVALARPLGHAADPRWEHLADSIFLRIHRNGVIRNHDQYRPSEEKGETPEAAAGLFPLTFECDPAVECATLAYYLRLADKYVGAPMLSALLGVYAARLGDRERALELFERGYADFVIDPFALTTEHAPAVSRAADSWSFHCQPRGIPDGLPVRTPWYPDRAWGARGLVYASRHAAKGLERAPRRPGLGEGPSIPAVRATRHSRGTRTRLVLASDAFV